MKFNFKLFIAIIFGIIIFPLTVSAEDITVRIKKSPMYDSPVLYTITGERDVTTVSDVKQALVSEYNIDLNDYIFAISGYDEAAGSEVLCASPFTCYSDINEDYAYLYMYEIDHTKKEYTLNSIPPKDEEMLLGLVETNYEIFEPLSIRSCNDAFDKCTFVDYQEFKFYDNVVIKYNYDKIIAQVAQAIIDNGLLNNTEFTLTDTELLHYFNYGGSLANYATSFKNQLFNTNFAFEMDQRGGADEPFETDAIGFYKFLYNDTLYAVKEFMSITALHYVYIPTDATNEKEALENRLNDIFGDELHLTVAESTDTINDKLDEHQMDPIEDGDKHYFILTVTGTNDYREGMEFNVITIKDSSKINNNVSFKSSDLITNVSVSTDKALPLDTLVNVKQITSGNDYTNIIKALDVEEGKVFDINLKSISQNKSITKLDNGKFLVSIPIPEEYEGKELVVYYVDAANKVTPYSVTVKDGYATFETDHFSIYTLAINKTDDTNNDTTATKESDSNAQTKTDDNTIASSSINNPATGDNIFDYFTLFIFSVFSLIIVRKYKNKLFNN